MQKCDFQNAGLAQNENLKNVAWVIKEFLN